MQFALFFSACSLGQYFVTPLAGFSTVSTVSTSRDLDFDTDQPPGVLCSNPKFVISAAGFIKPSFLWCSPGGGGLISDRPLGLF